MYVLNARALAASPPSVEHAFQASFGLQERWARNDALSTGETPLDPNIPLLNSHVKYTFNDE